MKSVESAYQKIAETLLKVAGVGWKKIHLNCAILEKGCGGIVTTQTMANECDEDLPVDWGIFDIQIAAIFLRDNLLATTGDRIWGLTFMLYPDGKFKIEYDYNKPEGYEETDETISMDDAIKRLSDFN